MLFDKQGLCRNARRIFLTSSLGFLAMVGFGTLPVGAASPDAAPTVRSVTLLDGGTVQSVIVLAANAAEAEKLAAEELQTHLQKISGMKMEIADHPVAGKLPIYIGQGADKASLVAAIRQQGEDPSSFALKVNSDGIQIVGLSPNGTLIGAYELLEQVGVRWFMPGELGTVIPNLKTVRLNQQTTIQVPSFGGRWHGGSLIKEWASRVRMGGPYFPPSHNSPGITHADFAKHPEYFALNDGKRVAHQLCVSNPEVVRVVTEAVRTYFRKNPDADWIGMGPDDGSGFCECEKCRALDAGDWDAFSNEPSMSDRYVWYFNQILDGIKDEFPDKKLGFYSYHTYTKVPVKTKPNPRIVPAFAPITLCRIHGMNNPICPERSYYKELMESWGKIVPEVYERGYWFNLADPGFPFSHVHRLRDEIPTAYKLGIKGWRVETANHWGSETPSLYIAAKLMWNQLKRFYVAKNFAHCTGNFLQ